MTRADVFAGLLLAVGFSVCLWEAWSFQYGTEFAPGPGFAPVWLSAIGIALSLLMALNAFKATRRSGRSTDAVSHAPDEKASGLDTAGLSRVATTLAGLVAMLAISPWLGLVPSILLFLMFLTLYVQRLSILTGIAASAGTVFFVYLVFVHFLDVPITRGPLGF